MVLLCFFFFKQKTAYEIYQCDWSSDVCSSDLGAVLEGQQLSVVGAGALGEEHHRHVAGEVLLAVDRKSVV